MSARERVARERVDILGVLVDRVDLPGAVARVKGFVDEGRAGGRRGRLVFTPNPEMIQAARHDASLTSLINQADLAIPDGTGVVLASRLLGDPLADRVAGFDLLLELFRQADAGGWRVFLLGTYPETVAEAARRVAAAHPGLEVAGFQDGYFTPDDVPALVRRIGAARPDLLVAALGSPKQERWLTEHVQETGATVGIGVGGSLDVLAGRARRAPEAFQRLHLEWLYRLASEPRRARRILGALPRFAWAVLVQRFSR
ncbi:MAG: WecB/TagA/CpsF family glycosyltransferase [Bacillota bacterium]